MKQESINTTHLFKVFEKRRDLQTKSFENGKVKVHRFSGSYITQNNAYGYVIDGMATLHRMTGYDKQRIVEAGNWFSVPGVLDSDTRISANGLVLLIEIPGEISGIKQKPFAQGEPSKFGTLGYIDGAENTLLYGPLKKGEPCINCLHIHKQLDQTPHTHPSTRAGIVLDGSIYVKVWDLEGEGAKVIEEYQLYDGDVWAMAPGVIHSFHTGELKNKCRILAFHPDSDFGPTDEVAPMINRTIVFGVSASDMPEIHTKAKDTGIDG